MNTVITIVFKISNTFKPKDDHSKANKILLFKTDDHLIKHLFDSPGWTKKVVIVGRKTN